jgi:hypothetical protein
MRKLLTAAVVMTAICHGAHAQTCAEAERGIFIGRQDIVTNYIQAAYRQIDYDRTSFQETGTYQILELGADAEHRDGVLPRTERLRIAMGRHSLRLSAGAGRGEVILPRLLNPENPQARMDTPTMPPSGPRPMSHEAEYRALHEKLKAYYGRPGAVPLTKAEVARMIELSKLGKAEGWIKSSELERDDSGGAWRNTNPPKKGKRAKASWYR